MASEAWKRASTIILLSKSTRRVLMLERGATAPFMPSLHVFPGGVCEPNDAKLGDDGKAAALRELFEETGLVPLANGQALTAATDEKLAELQLSTRKEPNAFVKYFSGLSSAIPFSSIYRWSKWLTPNYGKKRYMTEFFVLPVEGEPQTKICTREMTSAVWIEPLDALPLAFRGTLDLPPPQIYELTRLAQTPTDQLDKAENKTIICPQQLTGKASGAVAFIYPGDRLYKDDDQSYLYPPEIVDDVKLAAGAEDAPLHRCVFPTRPSTKGCRLYLQKIPKQYRFHRFDTRNKELDEIKLDACKM
ncbi:unnamed protein product, partial [Mesorhabditis spiculigera]